jgi:hypothetical protein
VAWHVQSVCRENQVETIGDAYWAAHVQRCARIRYIANGAIDGASAELNRSSLQDALPSRYSVRFTRNVRIAAGGIIFSAKYFAEPALWRPGCTVKF